MVPYNCVSPRRVSPTKKGPPNATKPRQGDGYAGHNGAMRTSAGLPGVTELGALSVAKDKQGTGMHECIIGVANLYPGIKPSRHIVA